MVNERIDTIRYAGTEVIQVRFDLADAELRAVARSVAAIALERAEDGYHGGTLVLGVARLGLAVEALGEWLESRHRAEFLRADEQIDLPAVESVLGDLRELHVRGLIATLDGPGRIDVRTSRCLDAA